MDCENRRGVGERIDQGGVGTPSGQRRGPLDLSPSPIVAPDAVAEINPREHLQWV
ncbi:hypothetical protein KKY_3655 [Pelagibacterium halotolerans B2]|uniref:Uncharacterized protein n=1 Tax=Pelagibacterium halotolerans (strain DSM 22347 / JCM 15775 / CGMCC 1.7692 / B2) TaxID=1082931 RepID=G4RB01_PELHB|nr:hypothetical protein KKY_3655 [Pelagibacterium halotolerans B2]